MFARILLPVMTLLPCFALTAAAADTPAAPQPIKAAVVTGGHDFDAKVFPALFEGWPDISVTILPQKDDSEIFEDISNWPYDVMVLYNMTQNISERRRANFLELLGRGVGLIAMHHSVAAFNDWPEYKKIIGVSYFLKDTEVDGKLYTTSKYRHDVNIKVEIADPNHPVAKGLKPFEIVDETYSNYQFEPAAHVVLTTDNPDSARTLCHVKTCEKANVCYIQLGHGPKIFSDPTFRQLIANAIRWTANRTPE